MSEIVAPDAPDLDAAVPPHRGDPLAEQRSMARTAAVVDRSHRGVIAVTGEDRLTWLHLLLTQHVSALPADTATESLILDLQGRVQHHMVVAHTADTVFLDTEPDGLADLLKAYEVILRALHGATTTRWLFCSGNHAYLCTFFGCIHVHMKPGLRTPLLIPSPPNLQVLRSTRVNPVTSPCLPAQILSLGRAHSGPGGHTT